MTQDCLLCFGNKTDTSVEVPGFFQDQVDFFQTNPETYIYFKDQNQDFLLGPRARLYLLL